MKVLKFLIFLIVFSGYSCIAQEIPKEELAEPVPVKDQNDRDLYDWPVSGSIPFKHKIFHLSTLGSSDLITEEHQEDELAPSGIDYSLLKGGFIHTSKEFKSLIGIDDEHIDWSKQKVFVFSTTNTYKHGHLEYSGNHLGYRLSSDSSFLYTGYQLTFHGVCQGIAQLDEWFSDEVTTYYAVFPIEVPEKIQNISCYEGPDCSGIP